MNFGWKLSAVGILFGTRIGELPVRKAVDRSIIWWFIVADSLRFVMFEIFKSFKAMIFCIDNSWGVPILLVKLSRFDALLSCGITNVGLVDGFLIENLGILNFGLAAWTEVASNGWFVKWKFANSASLLKLFGGNGCASMLSFAISLFVQHKSYLMKDDPSMKKRNLEKKTVL